VTFARLRAADWYSTESGEEARTIEDRAERLDVRERAAAGRLGPMALAAAAATLTALLLLFRILQEPGFDALTTVQLGAPLALVLLGAIAFAAAVSLRQEESAGAADLQSRR
jgi:hypothetical protein